MVSDGVGRGWEGLIWYWEGSGRVGKGWEGYIRFRKVWEVLRWVSKGSKG